MIKFRKGIIKVLLSGKSWEFGIDTREFYLFKIQRDHYIDYHGEKCEWHLICFLCFWLEIDIGR